MRSSGPDVFLGKGVLKICNKFTEEHLCQSEISIKLQSNFIEIALWHGCSPLNLWHIFGAPFLKEHLWTTASGMSSKYNNNNRLGGIKWTHASLYNLAKWINHIAFYSSATVREKYQTYLHRDWITQVQPGIFQFRGSFLEQGHFGNLVTLKTAF